MTVIRRDASIGQILIEHVFINDGTRDVTQGCISISDADLEGLVNLLAQFRVAHYNDSQGGGAKRVGLLATKPETDAPAEGDSSQDLWLGGGGGGMRCTITALYNADYFLAQPVAGGAAIKVAKSIPSRMGGVAGATDNARTVGTEAQIMDPTFNLGDTVFVDSEDSTDVSVAGVALTYIEKNTLRAWAHQCGTAVINGITCLIP
jgi:hypothetical protein